MNQSIFQEILIRIKSESPTLFKRLQVIFISLAVAVSVLIFLTPLHLNLHGLEVYVNWNTVMMLLTLAGFSFLPVKNSAVLVKKVDDEGNGLSDPDKPKPPKPGEP